MQEPPRRTIIRDIQPVRDTSYERGRAASERIINYAREQPVVATRPLDLSQEITREIESREQASAEPVQQFEPTQMSQTMAQPAATMPYFGNGDAAYVDAFVQNVGTFWIKYILPIFAGALIVVSVWAIAVTIINNQKVEQQVQKYAQAAETSAGTSSEGSGRESSGAGGNTSAQASGSESTVTDAKLPKRISVPSLGINATVLSVGVNSSGEVGTPANILDVGWYTGSSSPSEAIGSSVFVGHVGSSRLPGVFAGITRAQLGQEVVVTMGDNTKHTYVITGTEELAEDSVSMGKYLSYTDAKSRQLRLITCTGDYESDTYSYSNRYIVLAEEKI